MALAPMEQGSFEAFDVESLLRPALSTQEFALLTIFTQPGEIEKGHHIDAMTLTQCLNLILLNELFTEPASMNEAVEIAGVGPCAQATPQKSIYQSASVFESWNWDSVLGQPQNSLPFKISSKIHRGLCVANDSAMNNRDRSYPLLPVPLLVHCQLSGLRAETCRWRDYKNVSQFKNATRKENVVVGFCSNT